MNGSLIDLSARKGLGWLATVVQDLRRAAGREQVLLVGAQAQDLLLHHIHGVPIVRATTDVDLACAVADWDDFDLLRQALLRSGHPGSDEQLLRPRSSAPCSSYIRHLEDFGPASVSPVAQALRFGLPGSRCYGGTRLATLVVAFRSICPAGRPWHRDRRFDARPGI